MIEGISNISQSNIMGPVQAATPSDEVSKDEFLKLLTYQLKSQNPLDPMNNQEFAAQLAQFSQLEQLTGIRSLLEDQASSNMLLSQTISNSALPGLIGKNAKALSDKVFFDGEKDSKISFTIPYEANAGSISIRDLSGNLVKTIELGGEYLYKGSHEVSWDGTNTAGSKLNEGLYKIETNFSDTTGATFQAETYASGAISGVRFKNEGTMLVIDGMEVPLQNVSDITTQ